MKRRSLLQGAAAAVLGAPTLSGLAQQSVTLKFHTFMAPQSNVWLSMHKPWMEKVEKDSGGHIKFEAYPAMQLGGTPVQLYDQARDGVVDVVWTLPGNTAGRFPRVEVFELPFIMNNAEATSKAYWEYIQTQAPDEFKETQVIALQVHGPGMFHSVSKLIKSPADLKGMKVRGPTRQVTKLLARSAPRRSACRCRRSPTRSRRERSKAASSRGRSFLRSRFTSSRSSTPSFRRAARRCTRRRS
jgi:TRAP-type C4-dicarboxylate transport system substrate-binding protein